MGWQPVDKIVLALFNFSGQGEHQLSLEVGDMLCVMEHQGSWYRGHPFHDPSKIGIFPCCFVHAKEHSTVKIGTKSHLIPIGDEVGLEATYLLREWRGEFKKFYLSGQKTNCKLLLDMMEDVLFSRRHLITSNATLDVLQTLRTKLTAKLDQVNHFLSLPVSPRDDNGKLLNCYVTGLHRLYRVHKDRKKELEQQVSQTGALKRKEEDTSSPTSIHHLYTRINKVDHEPPEECEIFFFLYNSEKSAQVSERFIIHIGGGGGGGGPASKDKNATSEPSTDKRAVLFTDLGAKDLESNGMHLVCQVVRRGKMLLDDKKNIAQNPYRRPYACAVLEVSQLLQSMEDSDRIIQDDDFKNATFSVPLYLCSANHESDFASFHNSIIRKTGGKPGQKPGCALSLTVKPFHGDLNEVKKNYPSAFEQPIEMVHKLGFPDVILPGDVRNDIYVTVESGTFEKGTKRSERNVEVSIEVFDGSRQIIPRAIVLAAGGRQTSEYESFIFYHNNTPRWSETFKLSIPFEKLPDAHLRICFRHVAKAEAKDKAEKTFAFAFMKIMRNDGSIISDGPHELYVYKADHKRWFDPKVYLMNPSCKEDVVSGGGGSKTFSPRASMAMDGAGAAGGANSITRSFKESIIVSTLTCSTKLTQKIELLMLLKWRQRPRDLSVVLTNMLHIGGEEVVKFLQDTLDCLFDILSTNQEIYGEKIFEVLVAIFGLMQDDKYQHFKTVLDIYISKHFSAAIAHRFLVWCFEKHIREYGHITNLHSKKLCPVLKSMQYLFRFMVQSHTLYIKTNKKEDPTFREELKQVFTTLNLLMSHQENKVKDVYLVQSIVLSNLPPVLCDVVKVLSEETIALLIAQFLDSIRNTHATLPRDKLQFMLDILDGPLRLFHSQQPRKHLLPTYVSHLTVYTTHTMPKTNFKPEVQSNRDCLECIGRLLEVLGDEEAGVTDADVEGVVTLVLPLLRLSKSFARNNPLYNHNMVNLVGLLYVMQDKHYASLFSTQKSTFGPTLKDFLTDFMLAITNIIKHSIFPPTWVTMHLIQGKVLARALGNISKCLLDSFLDTHSFNPLIWDEFFSICTSFVTLGCLQLEDYFQYRRNVYQQQFGDLRVIVGKQVILLWHKLGSHKGQFIPDLINSFLKLSMLKQPQLRRIAIPLLFDVIKCEQQVNGNFKRVETEAFDKVDELVFSGQGDEEYKEMFSEILVSQCKGSDLLKSSGVGFIENVTRLIALLLDYRSVPTDDSHKGRKMGCMLNLLQFYKDIQKEELYIKYIYKLTELHEKDESHTEAGFTLLLHARGLDWASTDQTVAAVGKFPTQTARERKEQLYMSAVTLFDQGKSWECGIPLCKELAHLYETETFDYIKLASILQKEAEFFRKIMDIQQLRVAPEYFMVGYYAKGFPLFLRNKIFIHRGQPYEKLGGFIKRLTDEYTNAEVLKTTTPPDAEIQNSNGMYLQVRTVMPIAKQHDKFKDKRVPDKIAEYYQTNEVQEFRYDRPFHKGPKNKECEFASLWIGRTTFTTVDSFPGVISWFEVSEVKELELDPLSIALETMESKNQEIQLQTAIYSSDRSLSINPLSMLLNGVIDAAVMGGIGNYEKIFFNPSYISEHPQDADRVKMLRSLIEEQVGILEKALSLHGQLVDQPLMGFHSKLEQCFEDFQCIVFPERKKPAKTRKVARSATIARPLPPTPLGGSGSGPPTPSTPGGHATLPNKNRRATGFAGAGRRIATYEETEIEATPPPNNNNTTTTTTTTASHQRVLRKSSSPSPLHTIPQEPGGGSPKMPPPYQPKKQQQQPQQQRLHLSPSLGDVAELGGSNKRHSPQHSSASSLNNSDNDQDAYEPITDFLRDNSSSSSSLSSVPVPSSSAAQAPSSGELSTPQRSLSGFSPPSYPAPIPPKKSRLHQQQQQQQQQQQKQKQQGGGDEDEDDGYTPITLEGGQVSIVDVNDDGVERAVLPLLSSSSTRSSAAWDSDHSSSPMRGVAGGGGVLSSSPSSSSRWASATATKMAMPPEPTSPPPSPPRPPSSPQTAARHDLPPTITSSPLPITVKSPSPLLGRGVGGAAVGHGHSNPSPTTSPPSAAEQPKLPPKRKHNVSSPSSSVVQNVASNTGNNVADDDIYAFDTLTPASSSSQLQNKATPLPPSADSAADEDIYAFDTLDQKPPSGRGGGGDPLPPPRPQAPFQPSYDDENIYEFDNLEDDVLLPAIPTTTTTATTMQQQQKHGATPTPGMEDPPPIPKKSSLARSMSNAGAIGPPVLSSTPPKQQQQQMQQQQQGLRFYDDQDVYSFDSLEPSLPLRPGFPATTSAAAAAPQLQMHDDCEIYTFDNLQPPPATTTATTTTSSATTAASRSVTTDGGGGGNMESVDDAPICEDVYFDHLVTGRRPSPPTTRTPQKYSPGPGLPPRSSPPAVKKDTPPASQSESSPESAPPLPLKRRSTLSKPKPPELTSNAGDSPDGGRPRPTPRARGPSLPPSSPSLPPKPPTPVLPPRPAAPSIPPKKPPPKSNGDTKSAPPIPSKTSVAGKWPPRR